MGDEPFLTQITQQAEIAIDEADVIVFIVSAPEGITDADEKVAKILYRADKPVILAVNKADNPEVRESHLRFLLTWLWRSIPRFWGSWLRPGGFA